MAELTADGSLFCSEIRAEGLPVGEGIPLEDDLFASLNCQKGALRWACCVVLCCAVSWPCRAVLCRGLSVVDRAQGAPRCSTAQRASPAVVVQALPAPEPS